MSKTIHKVWRVEDVATDATSVVLSDPTGTYGVKRNDNDAVVVADGTAMTKMATGTYQYSFDEPAEGLSYTAYLEIVYDGDTYWIEDDIPAAAADTGVTMTIGYDDLCVAVGHYLGWGRDQDAYSDDRQTRIDRHIRSGLLRFYNVPNYTWGFLQPENTISTVAPYATGTVTISSGAVTLSGGTWPSWAAGAILNIEGAYYNVTTRTDDTDIIIDDSSVDADAGTSYSLARYAFDLPSDFSHFDGDLEYRDIGDALYGPVKLRTAALVRRRLALCSEFSYPSIVAMRAKEFDDTVGQRYEAIFDPPPDAAYTFWYSYRVTPSMISTDNPYPLGGTEHAETIMAACIAAAERVDGPGPGGPENLEFDRLLAISLSIDKLHHAPTSLGVDPGQEGEESSAVGRSRRGQIYWDAGCEYTGLL